MNIYTMQDWERDKVFYAQVGQMVEDSIVIEMRDSVPPVYWGGGVLQVGDPWGTDKETFKTLFTTFARNEAGAWVFMGHCLYGKTEHRQSWGE